MLQPSNPLVYSLLPEVVRLCCHSTTISYEGAAIESVQVLGATVLAEVVDRYTVVADTENATASLLTQFEVQVRPRDA